MTLREWLDTGKKIEAGDIVEFEDSPKIIVGNHTVASLLSDEEALNKTVIAIENLDDFHS